jgi:hypothetical protein
MSRNTRVLTVRHRRSQADLCAAYQTCAQPTPTPPSAAPVRQICAGSAATEQTTLCDAAAVCAPEWWVGAGVIRDLVWDVRFGSGFDPAEVRDVDVAFFDATDLSPERDQQMESCLVARNPEGVLGCQEPGGCSPLVPGSLRPRCRAICVGRRSCCHLARVRSVCRGAALRRRRAASGRPLRPRRPPRRGVAKEPGSCNHSGVPAATRPQGPRWALAGCASPSRPRLKSRGWASRANRSASRARRRIGRTPPPWRGPPGSLDDNGRCGRRRRRRSRPRSGSRSTSRAPNRVLR